MQQLADEIWVRDAPHRMFGVEIGARMTVVRLDGGGLWLHSPVEIDDECRRAIDELGPVRHIVAPNRYHHVYVGDWADAYPDAQLWAAPGLPEKRTDLTFDHVLTKGEPAWEGEIDQMLLEGVDVLREVVFYHRTSRTLVTADLFFNESDPESFFEKAYLWVNGILGRPGISGPIKLAMNDREALRRSYEKLLDWDFERIVVAHGDVVVEDAHEALQNVIEEDL